jgi:hypothetical protein
MENSSQLKVVLKSRLKLHAATLWNGAPMNEVLMKRRSNEYCIMMSTVIPGERSCSGEIVSASACAYTCRQSALLMLYTPSENRGDLPLETQPDSAEGQWSIPQVTIAAHKQLISLSQSHFDNFSACIGS